MTFTPNAEQAQALVDTGKFLLSDRRTHRITGAGGTGKTKLMCQIASTVVPEYFDVCELMGANPEIRDVAYTATTNKAAEELSKASGQVASTIHSYLGLTVYNDTSSGKSTLRRRKDWSPKRNVLIFVDEASMVDTPLLKEIEASTINCKVVFLGDKNQLKPVMEANSPVYGGNGLTSELTQPMRTDIPELQALNQQFRDTVTAVQAVLDGPDHGNPVGLDQMYKAFKPVKIIPGIIDYMSGAELKDYIDQTFNGTNREDRIVAFTNRKVRDYNRYIRSELRKLPTDRFTVGEILVNNQATQLTGGMISTECEVEVIGDHGFHDEIIKPFDGVNDAIVLRCQVLDLATYKGEFDKVMVPLDQEYLQQLIKYFGKLKDWPTMYALKERYPDLREREAATLHKVQGASHNTVIIDTGDMSTCRVPDTMSRLLYVGGSRARKRVIFTGELIGRYGGFIHP